MADNQERENPFVIDRDRLDVEWVRQPKLSRDAGTREADARHATNQAKARLEVVKARQSLKVRDDPEAFDLEVKPRPSNDVVEAAVIDTKEYQEALREYNEALYEQHLAETDTVAMIDRRKALENLVELLRLDYYAERDPRPLSQEGREELSNRRKRRVLGDGGDPKDLN